MIETNTAKLHRIGAGFCGTVWATWETGPALKREDGGRDRSLKNDFEMHRRILNCLQQVTNISLSIRIPYCYKFIQPTDSSWWADNILRFPEGYSPCNVIESQRIPPFPQPTRELLISTYCPQELAAEILQSDANKDCLIRPYLGRRRTQNNQRARPSKFKAFSLRNYPLHADQMEEIGIPAQHMIQYAQAMAETLAIMHWLAKIDANDVEFVLAPPDNEDEGQWVNVLGEHTMWILDFDLCRSMAMDEHGIEQAARAFWRNDPFYPRPRCGCSLWQAFQEHYLQVSRQVAAGDLEVSLSKLFIEKLVEEGQRP